MRIFKDSLLKEEIKTLDLGIVTAGEKKEFTFYVLNEKKATLKDIKFSVEHSEVKILSAPESLEPEQSKKLVIQWFPSVTLKQGLRTLLKYEASELWS